MNNSFQMVADTSALIAVAKRELRYLQLAKALYSIPCLIPAPVVVEYRLVMSRGGSIPIIDANAFLDNLLDTTGRIVAFDVASANAASVAMPQYAKGNGYGGLLNMLDLMVYGVAKVMSIPILCTGKDFASTDAMIHSASRIG